MYRGRPRLGLCPAGAPGTEGAGDLCGSRLGCPWVVRCQQEREGASGGRRSQTRGNVSSWRACAFGTTVPASLPSSGIVGQRWTTLSPVVRVMPGVKVVRPWGLPVTPIHVTFGGGRPECGWGVGGWGWCLYPMARGPATPAPPLASGTAGSKRSAPLGHVGEALFGATCTTHSHHELKKGPCTIFVIFEKVSTCWAAFRGVLGGGPDMPFLAESPDFPAREFLQLKCGPHPGAGRSVTDLGLGQTPVRSSVAPWWPIGPLWLCGGGCRPAPD